MSRPTPAIYKATNWPADNEALKRRGSLTIWFDPEINWDAVPNGKRGRQQTYSDAAIQSCLSMKVLFGMALRQTTGFVESLLRLVGLDWAVPDFSTLSRRQKTLAVNIPYRGSRGPLHLLIDSTGIKVEGEGKWHARKYRGPKRRAWRKIHLGIDEETLEIRAMEITGIEEADVFVIAIDNKAAATELARYMHHHHPKVHVVARAIDRWHVYDLWAAGCRDIIRETYDSSIRAARSVFEAIGHPRAEAEKLIGIFEAFDRKTMVETAQAFIESDDPHSENSAYSQLIREKLGPWEMELKAAMKAARYEI